MNPADSIPPRLGRYRPLRKLGEGGMGVVYAAHDHALDRPVALKTFRNTSADPTAGERLRREARAAASVTHPNICQIYEIGEHESQLFIAMELLQGESLASQLARGPVPVSEAVGIALAILGALQPLHERGLIHRDLKPTNVFVTPHGIKLLDFGLARSINPDLDRTLTLPGVVMGTPGYMAPEQILDGTADLRGDLFAIGVMLHEMLVGRAPFGGETAMAVINATLNETPPALSGSAAATAIDRVIRRALAKRPEDRFESAAAMAAALRPAATLVDSGETPRAHATTRLVVLPFRLLRPDPEIDFLSFSLADAIASTLSGIGTLLVRSTVSAAPFTAERPDLKRIAAEVDVDVVVTGTLLRAGDRLRVQAQMVSASDGTILWSDSPMVSFNDIFQLQDDVARRLVESLSLPLTAREHKQLGRDVPATPKAYELFLRANQHLYHPENWTIARELYVECLAEDPRFAPAWARLGRCYRLTAKFTSRSDEELAAHMHKSNEAFRRALELNPDLPLAHNLYTFNQADLGQADDAVVRLLEQLRRRPSDPELYAGLVHACRYAGLLDSSIAAHRRARELDPKVPTSGAHSYWMKGDYEQAAGEQYGGYTYGYIQGLSLASAGRTAEAVKYLLAREGSSTGVGNAYIRALRLLLENRADECLALLTEDFVRLNPDPESRYYLARTIVKAGAAERGLAELQWIVDRGYNCVHALLRDPWLDAVRHSPAFTAVVRRAEAGYGNALAKFTAAGGDRLLR